MSWTLAMSGTQKGLAKALPEAMDAAAKGPEAGSITAARDQIVAIIARIATGPKGSSAYQAINVSASGSETYGPGGELVSASLQISISPMVFELDPPA